MLKRRSWHGQHDGGLPWVFRRSATRDLIGTSPLEPRRSARYSCVTAEAFLAAFGKDNLRDMQDAEQIRNVGLASPDWGFSHLRPLPILNPGVKSGGNSVGKDAVLVVAKRFPEIAGVDMAHLAQQNLGPHLVAPKRQPLKQFGFRYEMPS